MNKGGTEIPDSPDLFDGRDHATADACAGVPAGISLQIVLFLVNDDRLAHNRIWAAQFQVFFFQFKVDLARSISFYIPEITDVSFRGVGPAMVTMGRIEMGAGG